MGRVIPDQMPEMVTREQPSFWQRVACLLGQHTWVARTELGGEPDPDEIKRDAVGYFFVFAAPVCKHCPRQLPPRI